MGWIAVRIAQRMVGRSLLLEHGAEVDLRDRAGHTPLMTALRSTIKNKDKLREVVRVLTEAGAGLDE